MKNNILKIKNIILIYLLIKNILNNNYCCISKHLWTSKGKMKGSKIRWFKWLCSRMIHCGNLRTTHIYTFFPSYVWSMDSLVGSQSHANTPWTSWWYCHETWGPLLHSFGPLLDITEVSVKSRFQKLNESNDAV